ncbi:MAG: RagB/SusD family nutrient uptake outer membrane protein [Chitinophagaceae bacterium]|nr:RagB/SusD family nutrient uptake outer membrane protein [Chitinophagaceae bacterium]MCW5929383.1 RagB/SusD family nutrient uptake outer membrane protein [Chitinophagaceae bacterium]
MKIRNTLKLTNIVFIILLAALLNSCQKQTLDLQPYTAFSDLSAFSSVDRVELAVNGVYDAAQTGFYQPTPGSTVGETFRGYPFGAASIEQGDMRGEDMLNNALFFQITYEATYTISSANNVNQFMTLYTLINKANLTIEGVKGAVDAGIIPSEVGNAYEGELRFLRALAHHELVINFSRPYADNNGGSTGIIYRDFGVNADDKVSAARELKRSDFTVAQNYSRILEDLDFAESNLSDAGALKTYRANKAAAIALKMRVKQHMGDWPGVIAEGAKIVSGTFPSFSSPSGGWKLTATPEGPFTNNTSDESIFSIKNAATDNTSVNAALANMLGDPADPVGGRGLVRISPIIWSDSRWLCDDLRRTTLVRAHLGEGSAFSYKYRDVATHSDAAPLIRYAEVLLMLAEAEARNAGGVSATALDLLNAVRNRAVNSADAYTIADFADKDELIAAILFERRVELLGEGKRWGDIHRLALDPVHAPLPGGGVPAKVGTGAATSAMFDCAGTTVLRTVAAIPYSDHRFLWPIPEIETRQNENYTQNPSY